MDSRESPRMGSSDPGGGVVIGSNSYATSQVPNNSVIIPQTTGGTMQGMHLSFNHIPPSSVSMSMPMESTSPVFLGNSMSGSRTTGVLSMSEPVKKKRGRPRKYGPDGNMALALSPLSSAPGHTNSINANNDSSDPGAKRIGRPRGSRKKQQLDALGSAGLSFTPHIINVKAGEDVASKIMAFSQQGSRTICILSANGAISNVTLRQPATSGGTVTYEGRFEILSLSGSYLLMENGGTRSRTGGLSVALAGSDGRVLGGGVAGMLMAAAPVQVVVGSFIAEGKKPKAEPRKPEQSSAHPQMVGFGAGLVGSPPSRGTSSESSGDGGSPINHNGGLNNNNISNQHIHTMPAYTSMGWPQSMSRH